MPKLIPLDKDFIMSNITVNKNKCWIWNGRKDNFDYGITYSGGSSWQRREKRLHRVVMTLWKDFDFTSDLYVCHKCDNPPCCNPEHLFVGTQKDNMQDSLKKGRYPGREGSKHGKAQVDEEDVIFLRELKRSGISCREIQEIFSLSKHAVYSITKRRTWRHI